MTATAFEEVIQKAVKKGKGVKKEVLEEIKIEKEIEKEHEIDKEVEKRIREGELSKIEYPLGDKAQPVTMIRNPEDEVYGNLPMSFKVDISDAVNFVEAWDNAKPTDMRAAFMQSHLTNKVKDEYFEELRKRLEVAKRQGNTQITMPTPNQEMIEEMRSREIKEEKSDNNDLAATLAPLVTLQKIMGEDKPNEPQEKPTETVKMIMDTAKGISEGQGKQESPTETIKGIIEVAKELNPNQSDATGPLELTNAILAAAETMAQSRQPEVQQNQDIIQQITAISELMNAMSNKDNGKESEEKIQIPREDGSMMEMTIQQYMLSEILRSKLSNAQQPTPTQEQKQQYDTIQIQDPDGSIKTMPATTYISELALKRINENNAQSTRKPSQAEDVSQDNTKLMAALVATVERLSSEVSIIKAQSKKDDPIEMMDTMLAQGEKIDNFRRRFLGGGLTDEDKKREEEELEKVRAHEVKMAQMTAHQANRNALTNLLNSSGDTKHSDPNTNSQQQIQERRPSDIEEHEKEKIRRSQRRAEEMIESLAHETELAKKIGEENASKQKAKPHTKKQAAIPKSQMENEIGADKKAEESNVKEEKVK